MRWRSGKNWRAPKPAGRRYSLDTRGFEAGGLGRDRERAGPPDRVTLQEIHADAARSIERRFVFDVLGDDLEVQRAGQADHRTYHRLADGVARQVADEGAVDL